MTRAMPKNKYGSTQRVELAEISRQRPVQGIQGRIVGNETGGPEYKCSDGDQQEMSSWPV